MYQTPRSWTSPLGLTRRRFLGLTGLSLAAGLALPVVLSPKPLPASQRPAFDPDELFVGRRHNYDLTFWWFDRAGACYLSFQRRKGGLGYLALAGGQTTGFVGSLTMHMTFAYRSFMTFDPQAGRLVSQLFEEETNQGGRIYRSARVFNHATGKIHHLKPPRHGEDQSRVEEMPAPEAVDHLTGFFNWRAGVYGFQRPGQTYHIPTMPTKATSEIVVNFLPSEEAERRRAVDKTDLPFLLDVRVDPKMVLSKHGQILGWVDRDFAPVKWFILDVLVLGQVRAWLTKVERIAPESDLGYLFPLDFRPDSGDPK
jgi:hypothetical protein